MTILKYDLNAIASGDQASIFAVNYADPTNRWDVPSIYISCPYREDTEWEFKINHSSSSSNQYNIDSIQKAELLRRQLADLIETMQELMTRQDELNVLKSAHRAAQRAEWVAKQVAEQTAVDADMQLTPSEIGMLLATMYAEIKRGGLSYTARTLRYRGKQNTSKISASCSYTDGPVTFRIKEGLGVPTKISQKNLMTLLLKYGEIVKAEG